MHFSKLVKNPKGQAVIEFFLFLPLFLILFLVMVTISASINGSINQQKATRGYFYFTTKGNAKIPTPLELDLLHGDGIKLVGMHTLGWMDHQDGEEAVAPCYKLGGLVSAKANDTCDDTSKIDTTNPKSKFIRVYTAYGICSAGLYEIEAPGKFKDISSGAWYSNYCRKE